MAYISIAIYPPTTALISNNSLLRKCEMGDNWAGCGDGSVDVDGSSTRLGCRLSSTEFLLKSLALLFIEWAFSPGQGHISNSSEVATIATGRSLTTSTLKLVGVTFFFRPSAGHPPSYPWFGIHVPLPPCLQLAVLSYVIALVSSLTSAKTRSCPTHSTQNGALFNWTTQGPPPILRVLGDFLYILLLWARLQHLRLSSPDDELITLSFCRVNDAENLRHRINSNCCLWGCDRHKLTGSHDYT